MRRVLFLAVAAMLVSGACRRAKQTPAKPALAKRATEVAPGSSVRVAAFWAWFQNKAAALRADKDLLRTMETINEELEVVHDGVFGEIEGRDDDRTLVITADGQRELFPAVQEIYAARPQVPRWTIVAFRPRRDDPGDIEIELDGRKHHPRRMKFTGARDGKKVAITVFVPWFTTREELGQADLIVLDHLVGEYDLKTKVGDIRWANIKQAPATARPLVELPALLDKTFPPRPAK